jgi:hypothetical protein
LLVSPAAANTGLVGQLRRHVDVALGGMLYAVPPAHRPAVAHLLTEQEIWVRTDVFADARTGVSLDLIGQLADRGAGPVDVHLLTAGALEALDVLCRPGIARVTFRTRTCPIPRRSPRGSAPPAPDPGRRSHPGPRWRHARTPCPTSTVSS